MLARVTYDHPLFTLEGATAQTRHREINGTHRTYYCGAYWRNGFHEDGLASALKALGHFRAPIAAYRPDPARWPSRQVPTTEARPTLKSENRRASNGADDPPT